MFNINKNNIYFSEIVRNIIHMLAYIHNIFYILNIGKNVKMYMCFLDLLFVLLAKTKYCF